MTIIGLKKDYKVTVTASAKGIASSFKGKKGGEWTEAVSDDEKTYTYTMTADGDLNLMVAAGAYIYKVSVVEVLGAESTKYTVRYQNANGANLKDAVEYDTYVGETYKASASDMATFYSSDKSKKYVYASGNVSATASSTVSENVITLVFDEYDKVAYTVTAKHGDDVLETLASGDAYTDGSTTVYWNKFKQFDGQWYETTGAYGKTITEAANIDVTYTPSTITYFVEAEKINKSRAAAANATGTQYSGGESQRHYGDSQWWTDAFEEGGCYKLYFPYGMANKSSSTIEIKTRDAEGTYSETGLSLTTETVGSYSNFVTIPAGSSLAITKGQYNSNILIDYFALTKISSMSIVGDFSENGWEPTGGIAMTQDSENANIWTAVVTDYVVTSDKYAFQYKAIANQNWSDYVIGNPNASNSDKNQEYNFDYDGARAGVYTLTFTLNTAENTVELAIAKQKQTFTVAYVDNDGWGDIHAYTFNSETLGGWPGTAMDEYKTIDGKKVYTISFAATDAPANIIFNGNSSQTGNLDFVNNSLYGIAWPTANVTSAGYATFCSPYALDFSDVSGVTAYIASESDKDVSFVEVTSVPAETGVLLKANEGSYPIKPVVNSTTDVTANALVGVLENTEIADVAFVLMNGEYGVGFYKTTKTFTVGANTAYLPASVSARSFIGFEEDGETTGVSEALSVKGMDTDAPVYNLQGQRVSAPQRGLFIQNGKKYIVK